METSVLCRLIICNK